MDTYLHACRCKVNQNHVTMLTKAKISSDVLGIKIASETMSQHQIRSRGACPQTPLGSVYTLTYALQYKYMYQ